MRRTVLLMIVLLMGCSASSGDEPPVAGLKVPACILVGTAVQLDASASTDADGDIVKYIFTIGHGQAPIISEKPKLTYLFEEPIYSGKTLYAYQILVTVVDSHGNTGHAEAELAVVFNEIECPGNASLADAWVPVHDIVEQELAEDLPSMDDVPPTQDVLEAEAVEPPEIVPDETAPPEVKQDTNPGLCPNVAGNYHLEVYCFGSIAADLELPLQQGGCYLQDPWGLFEGTIYENGTMELSTDQPDLKMADCDGEYEPGPDGFSLNCTSGCTAVFTPM